jgi:uncharacterized protein YwgA
MNYDKSLIIDFADDIQSSNCDSLVLAIIYSRDRPISKARVQREALIYNQAYTSNQAHEPYYYGGYSDDVSESYSILSDIGMVKAGSDGMVLTGFGNALSQYMGSNEDYMLGFQRVERMESSMGGLSDRELMAITYRLFPELARKSSMSAAMDPLIEILDLNGKPLKDWGPEEFLDCVREGRTLSSGRLTG